MPVLTKVSQSHVDMWSQHSATISYSAVLNACPRPAHPRAAVSAARISHALHMRSPCGLHHSIRVTGEVWEGLSPQQANALSLSRKSHVQSVLLRPRRTLCR